MTTGSASATRSGPSPRAAHRGIRVLAVVITVIILYAITAAVLARPSGRDYLDVTSPLPDGARALAEVLRDRGVGIRATRDVATAVSPAAPATVLVIYPGRLNASHLGALAQATRAGDDVVLLAPDFQVLDALHLPLREEPTADLDAGAPHCDLAEARTAGTAHMGGGLTYAAAGVGVAAVTTCYPAEGAEATLAVLPPPPPSGDPGGRTDGRSQPGGRFVVLSSAEFMTNRYLDEEGNAALAVGLLGRHAHVSWLAPQVAVPDAVSSGGIFDLLGPTFWAVVAQIVVGLVLLALWRGRRLGPPVPEALPVVVRAAETVEGRGRLYAAAHAREHAAAAMRAGAAVRLADELGLPVRLGHGAGTAVASGGPDPVTLVASVAEHTGRPPQEINALLYGSDMTRPGAPAALRRGHTPPIRPAASPSNEPAGEPAHEPAGASGYPTAAGYPAGPHSQAAEPTGPHAQPARPAQPAPAGLPAPGGGGGRGGGGRIAGPDPDDAALLRLALDLDVLDRQVGTR